MWCRTGTSSSSASTCKRPCASGAARPRRKNARLQRSRAFLFPTGPWPAPLQLRLESTAAGTKAPRRDLQSVHFPFKSCSVFQRMIHFIQHSAFVPRPSLICGTSRGKAFSHGRIAPGDRCVLSLLGRSPNGGLRPRQFPANFQGGRMCTGTAGYKRKDTCFQQVSFFVTRQRRRYAADPNRSSAAQR